ncbi:unnamed protein product [Polarella glacialis]|uniref:Uncharacterized protein n=1 Tax=Polarella glacialis TaxID=89957 RepID=A0A813KNZ2_POLGL|nr:unnamed protein product [Polarella glacialis]
MACRTPIDGLSDTEASSESSSDHSSDSEGKPDQDRPLAACFCCGHRLRKRAVVLLLSMVACQFVCMTLPLLFDDEGQFRWAAALGHWIAAQSHLDAISVISYFIVVVFFFWSPKFI